MKEFIKVKLLKLIAYFSIALTPVVPALIWLGVYIAADLITGIWKARKAGEPIKSKKLGNTTTKVVMIFIGVICAHVLDTVLLVKIIHILPFTTTQAIVGFFSISEFKSIMENISAILGTDVWKHIRKKIDLLRNAK